jgi:hypothetical protein
MQPPKVTKGFTYFKHIQAIRHAGGRFYVTNCQPWAVPASCTRQDCPIRALSLPPEAQENDHLMECDPPGLLADLILMIHRTQEPTRLKRPDESEETE